MFEAVPSMYSTSGLVVADMPLAKPQRYLISVSIFALISVPIGESRAKLRTVSFFFSLSLFFGREEEARTLERCRHGDSELLP